MDRKNIVYLSYDGMTDPLGQSQVIPYLIGLSRFYDITIVSCEKPANFSENKEYIQNLLDRNNIRWEPIQYHKQPPIVSTVFDCYCMLKQVKRLHKRRKIDLVHCRSYISALVGLKLKVEHHIPFLFDMRGFWVDERVDGAIWNLKNPVYKTVFNYYKRKEKEFLEHAAAIICLTHAGKKEILKWPISKKQPLDIEVIPCSADIDHFSPENVKSIEIEKLKNDLKIKLGDFILTYLGSIGTWYLLDDMLLFFKKLLDKKSASKFLFVTADDPSFIVRRAEILGIDVSKIIIRKASRKEVPSYLALSDYSIFFIKPAYSKIASSPTKQGEIMAMGIPLVCNSGIGDTDMIVEKYKAGFLVKNLDEESYSKVIDQMQDGIFFDKEGIKSGAKEWFSLEKGVESYHRVYKRILN